VGAWLFGVLALIGLAAAASRPASAQGTARTVWDGVYTREQATRGDAALEEKCAPCHGPDLRGTTMGPPLAGAAFVTGWSGMDLFSLYDLIRTTMPADNPSTLSAQTSADIVAAVLRANTFPAGAVELAPAVDTLGQIRIEPKK
jgi:S-disulfanyl-L-cysteine oxidoreductase SoxD